MARLDHRVRIPILAGQSFEAGIFVRDKEAPYRPNCLPLEDVSPVAQQIEKRVVFVDDRLRRVACVVHLQHLFTHSELQAHFFLPGFDVIFLIAFGAAKSAALKTSFFSFP